MSEFSRRDFVKVGAGGLALGFFLPRLASAAAPRSFAPNAFLRIDDRGQVTITVPRVEMGQGTYTSLPMLIAEELEVELATIALEHAPASDELYKDPALGEQITGGSLAIRGAFDRMRQAGAVARTMLITAAAAAWRVAPSACKAERGTVTSGKRTLSYGQLVGRAAALPVPADVALKPPADWKLIGTPARRLDAAIKGDGRAIYGIDVRVPGMKYAAVAACPVLGGTLASVDAKTALAIPGVRRVVQLDNAVAVIADNTWLARRGLQALVIRWDGGANAEFSTAKFAQDLEAASRKPGLVAQKIGDAPGALARAGTRIEAVYHLPFLAHAPMEPLNCTVELGPNGCDIWTGTQSPARARASSAKILGLPVERVRIHNQYLGGGFGRRLEIDYVEQAVRFAKQVTGPVKYVWSREEDIQQDIPRPAYVNRLSAALGADGMPIAWTHRMTGAAVMARFFPALVKDGIDLDAVDCAVDMPYAIPNVLVDYVRHEPPFQVGNWRGVGPTHNVVVVESFLDELAHAARKDPVAYRRALLGKSPRALAVLDLAAAKAGWGTPLPPRAGRGVSVQAAFGTFISQIAEVVVAADGTIKVTRVVCAVDCGRIVNPDTVRAQMEGGIVFALSALMWGKITFEHGRVVESNFHDYRVVRMDEAPPIEVHLITSSEAPGGIGEPGTAALGPAVLNAIFAATGKRLRALPIEAAR